MSDVWAVVLAVAVFAGALGAVDDHLPTVPLGLALGVGVIGWLVARGGRRSPVLLCLGAALVAAALGQRSLAGLRAPLAAGPVHGEVVLVGDPAPDGRGGLTVDVRLDGRRLRAVARGAAAGALDDRLAGERVTVLGEVQGPGPAEAWLRHRHVAGRLRVDTVTGWRAGGPVTRLANGLRRTLAEGARVLPARQASLLAGVTLGDDRAQPADMADAFRAAGLTHLLAVSGQNVAFVLVVAAPVLVRLRFGPRLVATLGLLALFALVTRAEPSVLRATAMASVAALGAALGRPTSTVRALALGTAGLLLVDPLLATSLGFRLSVAGAAGLVVGAAPLERALPGPRWLAAPLSVTLAAQVAVAPLLVAAFGSVPLVALPANLLAVPAAGPLMVWGLTAGLVAGVAGGPVASVLHLPTRLLLAWIEGVAQVAARRPLGDLRATHLAVLAAGALLLAVGSRLARPGGPLGGHVTSPSAAGAVGGPGGSGGSARAVGGRGGSGGGARAVGGRAVRAPGGSGGGARAVGRVVRAIGGAVVVGVVVAAVLASMPARGGSGDSPVDLGIGATLWRGGGAAVVVLDGRARDDAVLAGLRRAGVERVDLVVLRTRAPAASGVAAGLRRRWPGLTVLVPRADDAPGTAGVAPPPAGSVSPTPGTVVDIGGLRARVVSNGGGRLDVRIGPVVAVTGPGSDP